MELIKHFEIYIAAQRATGMQVAFFGAVLLLAAILLHFSQLNPITQGLRNSFIVISILLMASGIGFLANQKKLWTTNTEVYQSNKQVFKAQEITRMQKVNKSVPAIILGLSIALIILILAQVFLIHPPFWKGLTFGVLIYFLGLLITESISYLSVKSYLQALLN